MVKLTEMEKAKNALYGKDGLGITNFGITLGSNRDATTEQICEQINNCLDDLIRHKVVCVC